MTRSTRSKTLATSADHQGKHPAEAPTVAPAAMKDNHPIRSSGTKRKASEKVMDEEEVEEEEEVSGEAMSAPKTAPAESSSPIPWSDKWRGGSAPKAPYTDLPQYQLDALKVVMNGKTQEKGKACSACQKPGGRFTACITHENLNYGKCANCLWRKQNCSLKGKIEENSVAKGEQDGKTTVSDVEDGGANGERKIPTRFNKRSHGPETEDTQPQKKAKVGTTTPNVLPVAPVLSVTNTPSHSEALIFLLNDAGEEHVSALQDIKEIVIEKHRNMIQITDRLQSRLQSLRDHAMKFQDDDAKDITREHVDAILGQIEKLRAL